MVEVTQDATLSIVAIDAGSELAIYAPTLNDIVRRLEEVRFSSDDNRCVDCVIRLIENVQGELVFIRVNQPFGGHFAGWIVQLSGAEDYNTFALASIADHAAASRQDRIIEMFSRLECVDARCVLTHDQVLDWISRELTGQLTSNRFRWIDFSLLLSEI